MARPFLSVILPARNDAERLPLTLLDVDRYLSVQSYSYEIIVVDDGSEDNTPLIVNKLMPVVKNLKLISNAGSRGMGTAIKIGMVSARGNWRLVMDAVNTVSIAEFNKMMEHFGSSERYDIVIASRGARGTVFQPPLGIIKRACEACLNLILRRIAKTSVRDFRIMFQCYSGDAADKIFEAVKIGTAFITAEALVLASLTGFRVKEIPVTVNAVSLRQAGAGNYLQTIWEAIRIWWWLKRGGYGKLEFRS